MSRAKELREQIAPLVAELNEIERQERVEDKLVLIGQCFRYRNSYSCPQSESDKWWMYRKILGVDDDGALMATTFQIDRNGKAEIEYGNAFNTVSGWERITEAQYKEALDNFKQTVSNF